MRTHMLLFRDMFYPERNWYIAPHCIMDAIKWIGKIALRFEGVEGIGSDVCRISLN